MADGVQSALSDVVRSYRLRAGLSQEQLAERAGVSVKAIGAIEQGVRRAPYRHTIARLARALNLPDAEAALLGEAAERSRRLGPSRRAISKEALDGSLPRAATSFIEREEVARIQGLVRLNRCVTIVGPGGVGKTRTAVEAADRLSQAERRSAYFVDLSSLRDETKIAAEIASTLACGSGLGEDEQTPALLVTALASRDAILVLDNCEQIIAGVARLTAELLAGCPSISVLATSRERMGLSTEIVFRLPSLRLPDESVTTVEIASTYPAFALFLQRARHAGARLTLDPAQVRTIVEICKKLDGVPLAIELAAARLPTMGLLTLRDRLRDALAMPGSVDLPARQRTLDLTIAWSFELLSPEERTVLLRVSIFAGSFVLDAAEAVACDEQIARIAVLIVLTSLVEKSLVNVTLVGDGAHYALLESIRAFGQRRLDDEGTYASVARLHASWYADRADAARALGRETLLGVVTEIDNPRSAIEWCLASGTQADVRLAARIAIGTNSVWGAKGRRPALRRYLSEIIERLDDDETNYELIGWLWKLRVDTFDHNHCDRVLIDEATPFLERAGNLWAVAALNSKLAMKEAAAGAFDLANASQARAAAYFDADGERRKGHQYYYFGNVNAWIRFSERDFAGARAEIAKVLTAMDEHGASPAQRADTLQLLAEIEDASGDPSAAIQIALQTLDLYGTSARSDLISNTMSNLCGYLLRSGGDLAEAERYGERALRIQAASQVEGEHWQALTAIQNLAATMALRGRLHVAVVMLGFIEAELRRTSNKLPETDRATYDILVNSVRSKLPDASLESLRAEGARLTFHEAADLLMLSLRTA
jgi:predicted ATPase/DNA-binding XRE family transcriptional regulator